MRAFLATPEAAFTLLAFAALGVVLEVAVPGVGIGALGAVVLVAAAGWALTQVDLQPLGLALALAATALLVAGVFAPRRVWWSAAGALALLAAGTTLFRDEVEALVLLPVALGVPLAAAVLGDLVARTRSTGPFRGTAGTLVGLVGEVREGGTAGSRVRVHVAGAWWSARSEDDLVAGERVVVVRQDDLELRVARHPLDEEKRVDGQK